MPLVVVALVLTLGLAALLAVNAAVTAGYYRRSAEGVLQDYATLAADQFAERLNVRVATQLYPILALMASRGGGRGTGTLEPRERLTPLDGDLQRSTLAMVQHLFRIESATGVVIVNGAPLDDVGRRALHDSVTAHSMRSFDTDAYFGIVRLSASPNAVAVYAAGRDSAGVIRALYGFTIPDSMLR